MASEENCYNVTNHFPCQHNASIELINYKRLNYEEERIKTFASWPVYYPVDPSRLAKAGFYYTGVADEVICFSCQGHIKNWNFGDIVLKKHTDLYPNCVFVKNRSNNVPFIKTSNKSNSQPSIIENENISYICSQPNSIDLNKMKSENERLQTFNENWPLSFINISDLAHAGFFYTGINCTVQCPYCKGVISQWEIGSIPIQEHLRQFPWCDYLSGNIAQEKNNSLFISPSQDICGNMMPQTVSSSSSIIPSSKHMDDNLQQISVEDLGMHICKDPAHPQQASLTTRLKSFETWPSYTPVTKEDLAAAGFFYTGFSDRTVCFYCNGGLCTWEKGDDPWEEHSRWFPNCDFLRLHKGSDFIKSCNKKYLSKLKKQEHQESDGLSHKEPILKKVDEAMKSNLVKHVLETELFPKYIIRVALLLQIKQTGNIFTNVDDLCIAASHLKEKMEEQTFDVKPIQAENLSVNENISENGSVLDVSGTNDSICTLSTKPEAFQSEKSNSNTDNSEKSNSLEEDDLKDQCICKICMDKEVGFVFLPCGHLPACTVCAPALKQCPMCRKPIQKYIRVYLN